MNIINHIYLHTLIYTHIYVHVHSFIHTHISIYLVVFKSVRNKQRLDEELFFSMSTSLRAGCLTVQTIMVHEGRVSHRHPPSEPLSMRHFSPNLWLTVFAHRRGSVSLQVLALALNSHSQHYRNTSHHLTTP